MKFDKKLRRGFKEPLDKLDSEKQTYGCRANNPDICGFSYLEGVCAFVREDSICLHPSSSWKRQFNKLKGE